MEKAYWPFKLALLKLPTGGGGVLEEPPPPHPAMSSAKTDRVNRRRFIEHLPGDRSIYRRRLRWAAMGNLGRCVKRAIDCPFELCERRIVCGHRMGGFRRRCGRNCLRRA